MAAQGGRNRRQARVWWTLVVIAAVAAVAAFVLLPRPVRLITVRADGAQRVLATRASTVSQLLSEADIVCGEHDRVTPSPDSSLSLFQTVTIVRVTLVVRTHTVSVPPDIESIADPNASRGYRLLLRPGVPGLKEVEEQITVEDGVEMGVRTSRETMLATPIPERVVVGTRENPILDAFREAALTYLGRGGVTRLSPSVVEQTLFELARQWGDRYGSVRILTRRDRPWLVVQTFARTPDEVAAFVFWWTDELHAFGQIVAEGLTLLDARAQEGGAGPELGLVLTAGQASQAGSGGQAEETQAPHFMLFRLLGQSWQRLWTSQGAASWRSSLGTVSFGGADLERLEVRGSSYLLDDPATAIIRECRTCPHRRFESVWQRAGDAYVLLSQTTVPSPYASLWTFADGLRRGDLSGAILLASHSQVISDALRLGLGRTDRQWTTGGRETDLVFDLLSKDTSLRVTLLQRDARWFVDAIGPVPAVGRILFTGTRPVVRGLYAMDATASMPARSLGEGQRYVWSPNYSHLAYDWQGVVYTMAGDGSDKRAVGAGVAPAWSPDGKQLALERPSDKGPTVIVAALENGAEVRLAAGSKPSWAPTPSASGSARLAYSYTSGPGFPSSVYVSDVATGASYMLATDGSEPLWSPDGNAIAFVTSRHDIVVVTLEPGRATVVGPGWGYTWSPGGTRLAFLSAKDKGRPMVWNREKGESAVIVARDDVDGLSWSPDGKELVLSLADAGGLWLVGSDGSNLRKLADGRDPVWGWMPRAGR